MDKPEGNKQSLGVLVCGRPGEKLDADFGSYEKLFIDLFGEETFEYKIFYVVDGEFPGSPKDADAWLITGSIHGAYENHSWIQPLEEFIREVYKAKMRMVGICFGHQILAQALGGKVEKFDGGINIGSIEYQMIHETGFANLTLSTWHQDQVTEIPETARVIGRSQNCEYGALAYGDHAISLQAHPEFEEKFIVGMLEERKANIAKGRVSKADEIVSKAEESFGQQLHQQEVADWLISFLKS